jgi:hypothetical protein
VIGFGWEENEMELKKTKISDYKEKSIQLTERKEKRVKLEIKMEACEIDYGN